MGIEDFYDRFYTEANRSPAHGKFCERVYGHDLCQHGMADKAQLEILIEAAGLREGRAALDLGCGPGRITGYLQERSGCRLTGVDLSATAIALAKERFRGRPMLDFIQGDMCALGFPDASFDAVLLVDTHYFVSDFTALIPSLLRLLRPEGRLAIFSDQGRGLGGVDDSLIGAEETKIGRFLDENGIAYYAINLTKENAAHWARKAAVLEELKDEFLREGNEFIYENRVSECADSRPLDCRFLFVASPGPRL